jgi:hypothetical protein
MTELSAGRIVRAPAAQGLLKGIIWVTEPDIMGADALGRYGMVQCRSQT